MRYQEIAAPPHLSELVRCFWILEDQEARLPGSPERVLPDGCVELVVHQGDPFRFSGGDGFEEQPRGIVAGQLSSAAFLRSTGRVGMVGVRFSPGGAHPFLRDTLTSFRDRVVGQEDLFGRAARALEQELAEAPHAAARVAALRAFLERRLPTRPSPANARVRHAARALARARGSLRIASLAAELGWSSRTLERHFREQVGLGPKEVARIERFQGLLGRWNAKPGGSWADHALALGYADQAHASREFRSLAGTSPSRYLHEPHALSDHFVGVQEGLP